jgi:hypothetical protein
MRGRKKLIVALVILLAGCASPAVDRSAPIFDEEAYSVALSGCRGGSAVGFMLSGFVGALAGSAIGAMEGTTNGAIHGDSAEGAAIGAAVGGSDMNLI